MIKYINIIILTIAISSCTYTTSYKAPENPVIQGLAEPIRMADSGASFFLSAWMKDVNAVDSVACSRGISAEWKKGAEFVRLTWTHPESVMGFMHLWSGGYSYDIAVLRTGVSRRLQMDAAQFFDDDVMLVSGDTVKQVLLLWQNHALPSRVKGKEVRFTIPGVAFKLKRSYIRAWTGNGKTWSNEVLIPLEQGKVVSDVSQLGASDPQSLVVYRILVDRFADGDSANNRPLNFKLTLNPAVTGGDIRGVMAAADNGFFKSIGANALWISPIMKTEENVSAGACPECFTGYAPLSYSQPDRHLGTAQDLADLGKSAARQNLMLFTGFPLDGVHEKHPVVRSFPDAFLTDADQLNEDYLVSFNPQTSSQWYALGDSAANWLYSLWPQGSGLAFESNRNSSDGSFIRKAAMKKGKWPLPDFGLRTITPSAAALNKQAERLILSGTGSSDSLRLLLEISLQENGDHHLFSNVPATGNTGRIINAASVGGKVNWDRLLAAWAWSAAAPGVPVFWYGEEFGLANPEMTAPFPPMSAELSTEQMALRSKVARLMGVRRGSLAMQYGSVRMLKADKNQLVLLRNYFGSTAIAVFNLSNQAAEADFTLPPEVATGNLKSFSGNEPVRNKNNFRISLPAKGFDILYN